MHKGRLKSWNDERGFGFIQSEELTKDVFVHISALKRMARKPRVGDIIHFNVENQGNGKQKAISCTIEGVEKAIPQVRRHHSRRKKPGFIRRLILGIVIIATVFGYQKLATSGTVPKPKAIMTLFESPSNFSCDGKTHCSQMTSCEQATFYQRNCPGTKMDGDDDGIPCERQLCNRW